MQYVQYRALFDLLNILVERVAKHYILGQNMRKIEVKTRKIGNSNFLYSFYL